MYLIEPGDRIVLEVPAAASRADAERLKETLAEAFGDDVKVLVLFGAKVVAVEKKAS